MNKSNTEIYTLSLHDALPIYDQFAIEALFKPIGVEHWWFQYYKGGDPFRGGSGRHPSHGLGRSEEHTSELQSRLQLVCRLLLEKKKRNNNNSNRKNKITYKNK